MQVRALPDVSAEILALLAVDRADEAQQLVDVALKQASTDSRRIKQVELLMMAATIARRRDTVDAGLAAMRASITLALTIAGEAPMMASNP